MTKPRSFALVEEMIGRPLQDCVGVRSGPGVIEVDWEITNQKTNIWTPGYDQFRQIAIAVANCYRIQRAPPFGRDKVVPYVDTYGSTNLIAFLPDSARRPFADRDRSYLGGLIGQGETVYHRMREALFFGDGALVMDPFITLVSQSIDAAKRAEPSYLHTAIPPATLIDRHFDVPDAESAFPPAKAHEFLWAACLHEAVRITDLVEAELVHLTPGRLLTHASFVRLASDEAHRGSLLATLGHLREAGGAADADRHYLALRAGQVVLDASSHDGAAPFFMNRDEFAGAERFIEARLTGSGASLQKTRRANLSTQIGIDVSAISDRDIIAMRRDADLFNWWREARDKLAGLCGDGASQVEIDEKRSELAAGLREKIAAEQARRTAASREFRNRALIYGTLGAVVTGAAAAATGGMAAIAAGAAAGGVTGSVPGLHDWVRTKRSAAAAHEGEVAVQKHMLALDTDAPEF